MEKRHLLLTLATWALLCAPLAAQTVVFQETFETPAGQKPVGWTEERVRGNSLISWIYESGGGIGDERWGVYPDSSAFGNYNAVFGYQSANSEATKLITPKINLFGKSKPELRFWHVQQAWTWLGQSYVDQLKVSYKKGKDGSWHLLESYTVAVEAWTERVLQLPDVALTDSIFIGFEGITKYGNGTCIDNVKVLETGVSPRAVSSLSIKQPNTRFVASGLQNNPILRIDVNVIGNQGTCLLESLTLNVNNTDNADIAAAGVKLFYTADTFFSANEPLAAGLSISGPQVIFSGLSKDLAFGANSIWLTYDMADAAVEGHTVDMSIPAGGIRIKAVTYPASLANPSGNRQVFNKIYYDGYETDGGWSLSGDFERDAPKGLGGLIELTGTSGGSPDPDQALSGSKVLGNDLNGVGDYHGNYELNISDPALYNRAVSPLLDLRFYKDVNLNFQRWLNVYQYDFASIDVSLNNGLSWDPIWTNIQEGGNINDSRWELIERNISSYVQRKNNVRLRFTLGPTADIHSYCGWNVDELLMVGDFVTRDVGITRWMTPADGCGLTAAEPVKIVVKNYGFQPLTDPIPVSYSFDGGDHWVNESISHPTMNTGDSLVYTFTQKADLSSPSVYDEVLARTNLSGDEEAGNDQIDTLVYALPYSTLPYFDNFEQRVSFWKSYGKNSSWGHGKPNSFKIASAFSGQKAWKTNLTNYYLDNDSSFVESPCFNFTGIEKPIFEFKLWRDSEKGVDGMRLEYSTNGGTSWAIVPKHTQPYTTWNWYTSNTVSALNSAGWDTASAGWLTAKQFLPPAVANQALVKFRFHFESDTITTYEGFVFDDVKVYESPMDIGVGSFKDLVNNCQFLNSNLISFYVKNSGYVKVPAGTKILAGLKVNNNPVILDSLPLVANLNVGDSVLLQFKKPTNLNNPGNYTVKAWTMNEADPLFYHSLPNDTATKQIVVYPLPTIGLKDLIRSSRPDTITLTAYLDANYDYLWLSNGSTGNSLHIPGKGKFIVRVTDTRGNLCYSYDTTLVEKLVLDVGVDSLLHPNNTCELGYAVHPSVRIRNYGTDTLAIGDIVPVSFKLDAGPVVKRNFTLSQRLFPQGSATYSFADTAIDMSSIKLYSLVLSTSFKYDSTAANNSITRSVETYGYPTVNIGNDTLIAGLTYLLDAGPGYKSYLWNNGDTTQTYLARFIGNHFVTVTDEHDCPATDTAYIHLVIHDIGIAEVAQPLSACNPAGLKSIIAEVKNLGTDTLTAGLKVALGYSLRGNPWVLDTIALPGDLYPEVSVFQTFDPIEDFTALGNSDLRIYSRILGDINPANDTLVDTVSFWGNPFVNLGLDGVYKKLSHQLDAGAGANLAYLWNTGATTQTLAVTNTGTYFVTITDTLHACTDRDTIMITLLIDDLGILSHEADTVYCRNEFKGLGLKLKNFGNLNYSANKKIPVMYRINGGALKGDTAVVSSLLSGGSLDFTIDNIGSVPPNGVNSIVAYTKIAGDLRSSNDTLSYQFVISANPTVDLGGVQDTIRFSSIPYVLDAGSGFNSYSWNTGSNGQSINVSSDGWFRVTASDAAACAATDSVFMLFFSGIDKPGPTGARYRIFPNPAKNYLQLQFEIPEGDVLLLELMNPLGQVVYNRTIKDLQRYDETLSIQNFPRGIYLMRIRNNQLSRTEKIILE